MNVGETISIGGGNSNIVLMFTPNFGEDEPNLTSAYFSKGWFNHQQCPFGVTFAKRFADWWNGLRWGQSGAVSIVELYIDFCFHSKSMAPVCVVKRVYELRDESIIADHASNELSVQTRIFLRMVQWWYGPVILINLFRHYPKEQRILQHWDIHFHFGGLTDGLN